MGEVRRGWLQQLRDRGVMRVAASYAVIGWLLLQIADVTFEPLGLPSWAMPSLIVAVVIGFPVAVVLAWFYELGDAGITRDAAPDAAPRPHVHGVRRYADVAIIGVLLVVVAVLLVRQSDLGRPPPPEKPALAVMPFANLSADASQQYFSDGLAEEVLDRLGQVPGLMVVARSSSFSLREQKLDVRQIAERLGVGAVLEGTVRREGRRLRLTAKLVDGKTGFQLWSGSFDREVSDVFAVQAELAQAVIDAIVPVARGDTHPDTLAAPPPTTSLTAYDLYLLGRSNYNSRWTGNLKKAVEQFEQALAQDPKFARAQTLLALTRVLLIDMDDEPPITPREQRVELAETAVYQALALDPKSGEAQVAYANLLRTLGREGAQAAYERAIALNPNSADAWHGYAFFLHERNEVAQSAAATRRAHELDPLAISPWMNYLGDIQRPGNKEAYKAELDRAYTAFVGNPDALRRFAITAGPAGFPLEAWKFITAAQRDGGGSGLSRSMTRVGPLGLWMPIDPQYVIDHGMRRLPDIDDPSMRAWLLSKLIAAHGRLLHEELLDDLYRQYAAVTDPNDPQLRAMQAFWYSVFERYDRAAEALEGIDPLALETWFGPSTFGLSEDQQALPALLRTWRATGRSAEADRLARDTLVRYRRERPRDPRAAPYDLWVRDAALAANEGLKDEAVELLQQAMLAADVPMDFAPELPWFRSLEGHPKYDALLRELRARIAHAREGMLALDASLPPSKRI
jgi:adenylate cyclase